MPERRTPVQRRIRPSVPVTLGTVTLQLSFNLGVLARIEERTGLRLLGNIFTLWSQMSSAKVLGATFWAAAAANHPEYDSDEGFAILTSLLDGENFDLVGQALAKAYPLFLSKDQAELFRKQMERAKDEGNSPENPPQPEPPAQAPPATTEASSIGSSSGPEPDSISASASASSAS